jgi:hypothetical protein
MIKKPKLGIKPEYIFEQERIEDLAEHINYYVKNGKIGGNYVERIKILMDELKRRLDNLESRNGESGSEELWMGGR